MTALNIAGSSAIQSVSFGDNNAVGVKFTSNDTEYGFVAKDQTLVRSGLESAIAAGRSVGQLIAQYRAEGQLTAVWLTTNNWIDWSLAEYRKQSRSSQSRAGLLV